MVKQIACAALLTCTLAAQKAATSRPADPWQPLRFLIGTWEAKTSGGTAGATVSGAYTFRLELRDHVLARHTTSTGCKGPTDYDCDHGDLLYVYTESPGTGLKAIYFDNEGHVIHY